MSLFAKLSVLQEIGIMKPIFWLLNFYLLVVFLMFPCRADLRRGYSVLQRGHRLEKRQITAHGEVSFLDCVEDCLRTTICLSVNYFQPAHLCEVNFKKSDSEPQLYVEKHGWFYSEKSDWDKDMTGPCSESNCSSNERCVPKPLGEFACELSDCGIPMEEGYSLKKVQDGDAIGIKRRIHITCKEGFDQQGSELFLCGPDGIWKADLKCIKKYETKGCFVDVLIFFPMLESGPHYLQPNGRTYCADHCSKLGSYLYFGLKAGTECFCGNMIRYNPTTVSAEKCIETCLGNPGEMCGGPWGMEIFYF